jgi:hypothetical protein
MKQKINSTGAVVAHRVQNDSPKPPEPVGSIAQRVLEELAGARLTAKHPDDLVDLAAGVITEGIAVLVEWGNLEEAAQIATLIRASLPGTSGNWGRHIAMAKDPIQSIDKILAGLVPKVVKAVNRTGKAIITKPFGVNLGESLMGATGREGPQNIAG